MRGELIALQLAAATGNAKAEKAAAKLVKAHWRTWGGPLAPAIVASTVEMDRGLLDACTTDVRRKAAADAIFSHPNWATVRRLTFAGYGGLTASMRRLEEAVRVPEPGLEELATITLPRLRALSVAPSQSRGADDGLREGRPVGRGLKSLAVAAGLPSLRELQLQLSQHEYQSARGDRVATDYCWVLEAPFSAQLERFVINSVWSSWTTETLAPWVALARNAPSLRSFESRDGNATLVLSVPDGTARVVFGPAWRGPKDKLLPHALERRRAAEALVESVGLRLLSD